MRKRKPETKRFKKGLGLLLALIFSMFLAASSEAAFSSETAKKGLFPAEKPLPLGFSQLVEPNVLLLIDTSGSMTFRMDSGTSTYGDGTKPVTLNGTLRRYYGSDKNPGQNTTGNNDAAVDFNYHPLLRYIPTTEIADDDSGFTGYFSYERETKTAQRWVDGAWNRVGRYDDKPAIPNEYFWDDNRWYILRPGRTTPLRVRDTVPDLGTQFRYVITGNSNSTTTNGLEKWTEGYWETYTYNGYNYKYPNDSRMYVLKNVLYRVLGDSTLVGNLRLGLSSYYQSYYTDGSAADWYYWWPSSSYQRITWKSDTSKRAKLQVNFGSTTKTPSHLEEIRQWFDGTETSSNMEFRADGGTPLVASMVNTSTAADCALDFFKVAGTITDWCQDNWVIVLTDGEDSYESYANTAKAAQALYQAQFTVEGVSDFRPIKTMVIGMINPDEQTTLRDTLNDMADYGDDGLKNGSKTAYFPQDMQQLMDAFRDIFQTIQDIAATGSAPLVNPPRTAVVQGKAYSTGFKPKVDQQWTGYLYSYTVSGDVMLTPHNWEAGFELKSLSSGSRHVYTADWDDRTTEKVDQTNLKAFKSSQTEALRPMIADSLSTDILTNAKLGQFINWVRGTDVWDETDGSDRWKLGDPYHVGLVEIGAPQSLLADPAYKAFASDETNKTRTKMLYLHANDGMVHGFNSSTGAEEWAFIPPNILGFRRLLGTKLNTNNTWVTDDKVSMSRYLLDGPLVAEDIYLGNAYRTVLLGSLGRAGAGLYAMDVTDPAKPQFLWALENNYYDDQTMAVRPEDNQTFMTWSGNLPSATSSSTLTLVSSRSTGVPSRLRLTVSTPFIGTIRTDAGVKWIALLGAGAQNLPGLGNDEADGGGKAIYILDMADGSLVKELTHADMGMAVAPLSIEMGPSPLRVGDFYSGDHLGAVYEGDISSTQTNEWSLAKIFSPGEVASGDIVGIPYAIEIGSIKNRKWLFWGTGDPDGTFGGQSGQNFVISLNRNAVSEESPATLADIEELDPALGDEVAVQSNGWYLSLDENEMVSTPPLLYKGHLFLATYLPSDDNCEVGSSNLYIMKAENGSGGWVSPDGSLKKRVSLDATRISGITVTGGKVFIGATRYPGASDLPAEMANVTLSGNLLVFDVPEQIENQDDIIPSKSARPTYWRDWKP